MTRSLTKRSTVLALALGGWAALAPLSLAAAQLPPELVQARASLEKYKDVVLACTTVTFPA